MKLVILDYSSGSALSVELNASQVEELNDHTDEFIEKVCDTYDLRLKDCSWIMIDGEIDDHILSDDI